MPLRATLIADGSSDQVLKPILEWLLSQHLPTGESFAITIADLRRLPNPPRDTTGKLRKAWALYQGDVLFIHHDAEKENSITRRKQIDTELAAAFDRPPAHVKVVPVRMTEAWLLTNESAIREAAGNPSGIIPLSLPPVNRLDALPDPKAVLLKTLRKATGNNPRRRRSFNERQAVHRVADFNQENGFDILRELPDFLLLEQELSEFIFSFLKK